ncbi:glycerate kinase [Agromyces protaetiae]|uniref:Glycerate kinase n=1 Tax=Agromyces protaetiae TaxID=2509455 RepID=A0A4P6F808_9MICO|nr:glycerate kinase [Agromyces protaetiae]QAY71952.1 glycerate kinase [Agromyces protaetiae]
MRQAGPRRVVFAPDSFKGTVSAADAAAALARGWLAERPGDEAVLRPMADGGEGTLDAFEAAVPGAVRVPVDVRGPYEGAARVSSSWLRLPGDTAVVELAATCGLGLVDPLRPLEAHTAGFGDAIAAALDAGVARLLLGIGGSASTDGGSGALVALGARVTDASGSPVPLGGGGLGVATAVDLTGLRPLPTGGATVLGDVVNPLLGAQGAAAVFGPQKGAAASDVALLEANLDRFAGLVPGGRRLADAPGAGAAGGTGFGLLAWGARMGSGAAVVASAIGLAEAIAHADLVVTGEGRFDAQSEAGKAPTEVARLAAHAGVPVALVAGVIDEGADPDASGFESSVSLTSLAGDPRSARSEAVRFLEAAGAALARAR